MAQSNVYSLNIVGYVNIPVQAGKFYLMANPFTDGAGDSINNSALTTSFNTDAAGQDGSSLFVYDSVHGYSVEGYGAASLTNGTWSPGTNAIPPGRGFWLNPQDNLTITFTGSVVLSSTNVLNGNNNQELTLVGSAYPASTNLVGLGINWLPIAQGANQDGDSIFRWNSTAQNFTTSPGGNYGFGATVGWSGPTGDTNGPVLNVGEGFFYDNANSTDSWIQSFTVN